jgi:hypothetical protein
LTALFTIVASAVATVMWIIFANVFAHADPSLNIEAHVGIQMFVFMWIASAFNFVAFIVQFGSCCASCCGGHKARKQLKAQGVDLHEKSPAYRETEESSHSHTPDHPRSEEPSEEGEPHALTS